MSQIDDGKRGESARMPTGFMVGTAAAGET